MSRPKRKTSTTPLEQKPDARTSKEADLEQFTDASSETGSVDKIRDIIFGNQMRDYESRFGGLEDKLLKEISNLRDEALKRFDAIELFIKKEIESLGERLKTEQEKRIEADKKTSKELKDNLRTISKNFEKLDEKQSKDSSDLRQQLLDQSKGLSNEIHKKHKESSKVLRESVNGLQEAKVDRLALSELLMELAIRMSDEFAEKINLHRDG